MRGSLPPRWTRDELREASEISRERFRETRLREPLDEYLEIFDDFSGVMEDLLETTVDLTQIEQSATEILTDPKMLEAVRYLPGPPISADDLKVVAEASLAPGRLRRDPDMAKRIVDTVTVALDRRRFAWISEGREPTEAERSGAVLASAALIATQRLSTSRRNTGKDHQEDAVEAALLGAGLEQVPARPVETLVSAPGDLEFCRETMFGGRKADFVIGLPDGRKMPLECKVSNSSTNSVKRLNNDAAVKAVKWVQEFGTAQTVPAAMLAGVFKVHNLEAAQAAGLTIFWEHDLRQFTEWILSAT